MPTNSLFARQTILNFALDIIGSLSQDTIDTIFTKINMTLLKAGYLTCTGSDKTIIFKGRNTLGNNLISELNFKFKNSGSFDWSNSDSTISFGNGPGNNTVVTGTLFQAQAIPAVSDGESIKIGFEIIQVGTSLKGNLVFGIPSLTPSEPVFSKDSLGIGVVTLLAASGQFNVISRSNISIFSNLEKDKSTEIKPWSANTYYYVNDVIRNDGVLFYCTSNHLSGVSFDSSKFYLVESSVSERFIVGAGGQDIFNLTISVPSSERLNVFRNGIWQDPASDYVFTLPNVVTFSNLLPENSIVICKVI